MKRTKIEWCDCTLNPVVGCTFNCEYCYARKLNDRFKWVKNWNEPQFFPERLTQLQSKKPKIIFMNSMSDIADWKDDWLLETFKAIGNNPQHRYIFLTKRLDKLIDNLKNLKNITNILTVIIPFTYFGCTVDTQSRFDSYKLAVDMYSIEPILEPIKLDEEAMKVCEWIIIGAETGNRKDKVIPKKEWIDAIIESCEGRIPVFMKDSLIPVMGEENMLREFPKAFQKTRRNK